MPDEKIVLVVRVPGVENIETVGFNINGEITIFKSFEEFTEHEVHSSSYGVTSNSTKRFWIDRPFLKKLLTTEKVPVKVSLSRDYVIGMFCDGLDGAKRQFEKFDKALDEF